MSVTAVLAGVATAYTIGKQVVDYGKKAYEVAKSPELAALVTRVKDVFSGKTEPVLSPQAMQRQTAELEENLLQFSNENHPNATDEVKRTAAKSAAEKFQHVLAETRPDATPGFAAGILRLVKNVMGLVSSREMSALGAKIKAVFSGQQPEPALAPTAIAEAAARRQAQLLSVFAECNPLVPQWRRQEAAEKAAKAYHAVLDACRLDAGASVRREAAASQLSAA